MRICTACGKVTADDKCYCPICGTKLPEPTQPDHTNAIDEINLVNTRLRSAPAKPNNTAKYAVIIGALSLLVVIMIVVIVCVVFGSRPKSQSYFNYNTPNELQNGNSVEMNNNIEYDYEKNEVTQNNNINQGGIQNVNQGNNVNVNTTAKDNGNITNFFETGDGLCLTVQNPVPNPDIIQIYDDYVYIIFPIDAGVYYARASFTFSDNEITLGSADLYMSIFGEQPTIKGVHQNFHDVHVMDAGAKIKFNDNKTITIVDFENYWKLFESNFEYPYEFKNNTTLHLTQTPYDQVNDPKFNSIYESTDVIIIGTEGGERHYYTQRGSLVGDHIEFDSNYVTLYFKYFGEDIVGKATYSVSGNTVTLGTVKSYGTNKTIDIMDAGAQIQYLDGNILLNGFEDRWILSYDGETTVVPDAYKDGTTLYVFS